MPKLCWNRIWYNYDRLWAGRSWAKDDDCTKNHVHIGDDSYWCRQAKIIEKIVNKELKDVLSKRVS